MKFIYEYRTRDNIVHNGVVNAVDREAAFRVLKQSGIRPARLEEAPGFFNKLFGKGKRWIAIVVLTLIALALLLRMSYQPSIDSESPSFTAPRHQIYGDPAIMDEMEGTGFVNVFSNATDRYLARFAQPGLIPRMLTRTWRSDFAATYVESSDRYVEVAETDCREVKEIKQIVNGMRDELRRYLANGNGTPASYARRLEERQSREFQIYMNVKKELENEESQEEWHRRNEELRALGIKTIPLKAPTE